MTWGSVFRDVPGLGQAILGLTGVLIGLLVFVAGKIPAAIHAFKGGDLVWGTLLVAVAPFFPPLGVFYCLLKWREGRLPCAVMLLGSVVIGFSLYLALKGLAAMQAGASFS
jgi:uncharacterized membrane protein YqaE (UPF0057 family)